MQISSKLLAEPKRHFTARDEQVNGSIVRLFLVSHHSRAQLPAEGVGTHAILRLRGIGPVLLDFPQDLWNVRNILADWVSHLRTRNAH